MNILVVDDDLDFRMQISAYIRKYFEENMNEPCNISEFSNGIDLVTDYHANCDMIFLDIEMPHMDGIEAAKRIRQKDKNVVIVFITNIAKYAIKGYEVDAIDYVIKPIEYFNFADKLKKAINHIAKWQTKTTLVKTRDGFVKLTYSDIRYIEKSHNNIIFYTAAGEYVSIGSLSRIEDEFQKHFFCKVNSGCMVNLRYVVKIDKDVLLQDGEILPISRSRHKELVNAMFEYVFGRRREN